MGSRFLFAFGALFTVPGSFPRQGLLAVLFCFGKTKEKVSLYEYKISSRSRGPQDVENPVFPRRQAVFPAFPSVDTSVEDLWNRPLCRRRLLRGVESCGRLPSGFRKTRWKTPPTCRAVFHSPEKWRRENFRFTSPRWKTPENHRPGEGSPGDGAVFNGDFHNTGRIPLP